MQSNTECAVRSDALEAEQGSENPTQREKVGDPDLIPEQQTYLCDTIEEFRKLEAELGVSARWTRPRRAGESPDGMNRWKWRPGEFPWPKYGSEVY